MELTERKNHRLKKYDYGRYGYYYVTICTTNRINFLCEISNINTAVGSDALVAPKALFVPTNIGEKVIECFNNIAALNDNIVIDKFVLMPNHIHGIIKIMNTEPIELKEKTYAFEVTERRGRRSLQGIY